MKSMMEVCAHCSATTEHCTKIRNAQPQNDGGGKDQTNLEHHGLTTHPFLYGFASCALAGSEVLAKLGSATWQ
jgi:hypothetical protein